MITNSRLDKAINGLNELVNRHKRQDKIKVSMSNIIIETNGAQFWGTLFYVSLTILTPTAFLLYYLLTDSSNSVILWLIIIEVLFGYQLIKMIKGNTKTSIDLIKRQIQIENINGVFKKMFKLKTIYFQDLKSVILKEKSIPSRYSRISWLQLTATNTQNKTFVLTDLADSYPDSFIAKKVMFLFEVIIWTEKQNKINATKND